MITVEQYFGQKMSSPEATAEVIDNARAMLERVNFLLEAAEAEHCYRTLIDLDTGTCISGAKGGNGTWISLAEYDRNNKCVGFATGCIGQDGLLPDTYYRAVGGKLVAA